MTSNNDPLPNLSAETLMVHGGTLRSQFEETSEAIFATSGFVYPNAEEAEAAFAGELDRYRYSRLANPTVSMFEERLRLLEGSQRCVATATGMAAVFAALAATLRAGDRLVASRALFGSCAVIVNEILPRWGVETVIVDGHDNQQWAEALSRPAAAVLFETPANPTLELVDIKTVTELAHQAEATVIVDNVFATPLLQRPMDFGVDVVVYSATKHIDGQGRVLGGAICCSERFFQDQLSKFVRHTGPALSPFNAWVLLKGLETLTLRVERMSASAAAIAEALEGHDKVAQVLYPGLESHPQRAIAAQQMTGGGSMIAARLHGTKASCFGFMNALSIFAISNNLGDAKSLITHPATTTHHSIGAENRAKLGIGDDMIRVSVGLEAPADLIADLERALNAQ